jgi:HPr kinase/phosphorylase
VDLSLKPPKKSDLDKKWMKKRLDRAIKIQPEYHLIVTEGTDTEPEYFGSIKDVINKKYPEKIKLDVYGEGVLITGESGIGKSEAALELIKRGHRLVSDDVVELRKVSDVTLVGSAPDITRHFIELRGIGIIDVKTLFGVESVKDTQSVDLVIKLEEWDRDKEYDRLGLHEEYTEYLGNKIVCHSLPIRPGRNLAIIVESAAVNHRQKKMGYNAAEELYKRVQANLAKKREEK